MCGVVGYVGHEEAIPVLISGLSRLEYRGYDSSGVAVHDGSNINILKSVGRLKNLENKLETNPIKGSLGIGHTRWATHGKPSDDNSHPHFNSDSTIAVVHNGIIENYLGIKEDLERKGYTFISETDTETVAHLIDYFMKSGLTLIDSIFKTIEKIEGSYAFGVISKDLPNTLIAARKDSPLILGIGKDANYIASDMPAILNHTRDIYLLDENEVAVLTPDNITIYDQNKNEVQKDVFTVDWDLAAAEKGGYEYFMLKEIFEQPKVVKDTIGSYLGETSVNMNGITLTKEQLENINKIYVVACGTAFYAGTVGKFVLERMTKIPVITDVASEFRYNDPVIDEHTLMIVISQSGETADTLAALRLAKDKGATVIALVNVVGSSISREANQVFYTLAGPEIAVASTKAFTSQVISMYMLTLKIATTLGTISNEEYLSFKEDLESLPSLVDQVLVADSKVEKFTKQFLNAKNVFYIGRGLDYLMCMEGSLKLKEIAYIHSESYAAGELKHGPIALIEDSTLVIGLLTQEHLFDKTASNLRECKARGAKILAIAMYGNEEIEKFADHVFYIPRTNKYIAPILANIFQQLFAYYMAKGLGNDVDKPRNLAKSVTVE